MPTEPSTIFLRQSFYTRNGFRTPTGSPFMPIDLPAMPVFNFKQAILR